MKRFSFRKKDRLVSNRQFRAVLARNLCVSNGLLKLYVAENDCGYPRLGVSVGKDLGNAVVRNRLKRILREVFRGMREQIPACFDYLVMVCPYLSNDLDKAGRGKEAVSRLGFEQARQSFLALAKAAAERAGAGK